MVSTKTLATLFLITLDMELAASSFSSGSQGLSSPRSSVLQMKKSGHAPKSRKTIQVLKDSDNIVNPVEVQRGADGGMGILHEQLADQKRYSPGFLETLINRGRYDRVCYFARRIGKNRFLKCIYPLVKTLEQYNGLDKYLKRHRMVASFFGYGDMEVVKKAIAARPRIYSVVTYRRNRALEIALIRALKKNRHDRVIGLLSIRKDITAKKDEQSKKNGKITSFGLFVHWFLHDVVLWNNGMALKRFLTLHGDELSSKHHDIFDVLCQELVGLLEYLLKEQRTKKLLTDLVGQSSLLTSVSFTKGFLSYNDNRHRTNFIKYAWDGAIKKGLKLEYEYGGDKLWRAIQEEYPNQFPGEYSLTNDVLVAVLKHFPTKEQLEEEWAKRNAPILFNKLNSHDPISYLFPSVLWFIIADYAISWTDTDDSTIPSK